MENWPLENKLRPALEWWPAVSYAIAATCIAYTPKTFLLSSIASMGLAIALLCLSTLRFYQGWQVKRYQRNLRRLPLYTLSSQQIPVSQHKLFLGRGFRWQPIHTQRLYDSQQPQNRKYLESSFCYRLARKLCIQWENKPFLKKLIPLLNHSSHLNPARPLPPLGGNPALHGVELKEEDIWMNLSERVGHMLVLGTTRVGKTRFLEVQVAQDIRRGDVVIVFDPKGDGDLLKRIYFEAKQAGREDDVILFHLGFPNVSARYNPIGQFARVTEVANRIANQLPSSGESAAFKEFGWRFVNIIARALVALGRKPDYQQIQRYILSIDHLLLDYAKQWLTRIDPDWATKINDDAKKLNEKNLPSHMRNRSRELIALVSYIQKNQYHDPIAEGLCSAFNYDKTYFDKITASLLPLLEKLTTGKIAELISPEYCDLNDTRPIFDWQQVIRGKKIVYVGLDALSDSTVASAVGSSMFSDLCSMAGQLYKFGIASLGIQTEQHEKTLPRISVHADEFNEIANDDVTTLLNKSGGAGLQMTLYTQTWSDVEARLHSSAKAGQVAGNLNTIVCLRVLDEATAKLFTSKLPQRVQIKSLQQVTSVSDTANIGTDNDFQSSNEDRIVTTEIPLITPDMLMTLPKGQAIALIQGGQEYKIRIPLPKDDMRDIPATVELLAREVGVKI